MSEFRALGVDIFAGGFTIGVKQHFDVLGHLEEGPYGVKTAKLNFPELPVVVGESRWPTFIDSIKRDVGRINLVYCNPPCALFSQAGATMKGGGDAWKKDPRQSCWWSCFGVFEKVKPDVFIIESVTRAFTAGREFVDQFVTKALEHDYSVTHTLIDAQFLGVPQRRKRYFLVVHNKALSFQSPNWGPSKTVFEALEEVKDPGHVSEIKDPLQRRLVGKLEPGQAMRPLWEELKTKECGPEENWERTHNGVKGRPRMFVHRVDGNKPIGTITGDYFIHPKEDRFLGMNELKHLNGFPPDYQFEGNPQYWPSLIARGVCPPVAAWLAGSVRRGLELNVPEAGHVRTVDFRSPPK